jgi:hypothetical protein
MQNGIVKEPEAKKPLGRPNVDRRAIKVTTLVSV